MPSRPRTNTSAFGVGRREGHDASEFYDRFAPPAISDDEDVTIEGRPTASTCHLGDARSMDELPDASVALVVTSPPYFVGKQYEQAISVDARIPASYLEFLTMLREVFAECTRVLEPGGRIAVNVANLGRKPYRSLSADVISILQDELGLLLRGEVIWAKSKASSGSCAWGSFAKASNPVLRDNTERVIIASKGRFSRALEPSRRAARGLPNVSSLTNDEFVDATKDVWEIDAESATRVGHPAPFPVELPRRLIELYSYVGDIVVDPFAGAGSSLVAAERTGRIGIGYDLEPDYVALSQRRLAEITPDERDEAHAAALEERQKVADIATAALVDAGFTIEKKRLTLRAVGVTFDLVVSAPSGRFLVDVAGGFTTTRSGLERSENVWRTIGRHRLLAAEDPTARVLLLAAHLPRAGSANHRALRAGGPGPLFDAVELFDSDGRGRLEDYAGGVAEPRPGFWSDADLASADPPS